VTGRALGTLLVPLALSFTLVGCHLGSLRTGVTPARPADSGWLLVPGVPLVTQRERADCGAAALAMVLRFWQPATSNETVRSAVGSVDDQKGLSAGRLREVARDRGLQAFLIQATFQDLVNEIARGRPVIVGTLQIEGKRGYPHYEVVVGVNPRSNEVLTADPAEGWRERDLQEFEPLWRPSKQLALVMFAPGAAAGSMGTWNESSPSIPGSAARPARATAAGPAVSSAPPSPAPPR
jgi:predicted double-glycine peptidase